MLLTVIGIENKFTKKIDGYYNLNSLGYTMLYDFTYMSYYKQNCVLPQRILRADCNGDQLLNDLSRTNGIQYICVSDYDFSFMYENYLTISPAISISFPLSEAVPIYLRNIKNYILHRLHFMTEMLYTRKPVMCTIKEDPDFLTFKVPPQNRLTYLLNVVWTYSPPACTYYLLGGILLITLVRKRNVEDKSWLSYSVLIGVCFLASLITMLCAVSVQLRYIAPYFFPIYLVFIVHQREIKVSPFSWTENQNL